MRVLVTGAFGYVGRVLTRRLLGAGHDVVALTSRPGGESDAHDGRLRVRVVDVRDRERLRAVIGAAGGFDAVCHLAALTRVRESFQRPDEYQAVNVGGTATLLELLAEARRAGGGEPVAFVQASTASIYGAPRTQPITESAEPAPTSPYGETKLAAERAVRDHAAMGTVGAICLRAFNVAGSVAGYGDPDETRIIPRTLLAAAGLRPALTLNGDGSAVRDFVHVDDVALAYLAALEGCRPGQFRVYNVGATGASVREIIAVAEAVTGRPVPVERRAAQQEPPMLLADTRRIRDELGWRPQRSSLREMVADTWSALRAG